jgi:hypothetical protein
MQDLTKAARKTIRKLAGIAYERELSRELTKLEERFADWRSGRIDPFELNEAIHKHHNGVSRELFNRHSQGSMLDHVVATAILEGTIQEAEVPEEVREHLLRIVALYRQVADDE